ncbi:MAG: AMP-binding protein [Pseudomonadota bacterium]
MNPPPDTIGAALRRSASKHPDRIAVVGDGQRLSFRSLDERADHLALGLQALGIGPGDHVALLMTNDPEWVLAWMATLRLGAVLVPVNTRYKREEVEYVLRQSDAKLLITMDRCWDIDYLGLIRALAPELDAVPQGGLLHSATLPELRTVVTWRDTRHGGLPNVEGLIVSGRQLAGRQALPQVDPASGAIIVYTSGTTGFPKGAMHSHVMLRNVANIARAMHIEPGDAILGHMPFYHVAGACSGILPTILLGCTLVTMPQWEPGLALRLIEAERVAIFGGIPTHFIDCLDEMARRPRDTSSLKSAWIGGATVTPDVAEAAKRVLQIGALLAVYGMTETTSMTTVSAFDDPIEITCDNRGKPIGDFEVVVCDAAGGRPLPAGQIGEVWVRGHLVMMGYYKKPDATADVLSADGWFRTGDLGSFDERGYLKITGRLKDMFIVGGSNAYPAEIERVLQTHPSIKQAVVVGRPDRRLGEVGFAFVQLEPGAALTAEEIVAYCKPLMADYKVPRQVRIVGDFPLTSTGKIRRAELAARAAEAP